VVDSNDRVVGIITDGDLRRMLQKNQSIEGLAAADIMTVNPKTIDREELAITAFNLMEQNKITQLLVTHEDRYEGVIHIHDILREGIV
jgi:arabinose-5-phosphate isomerase